MFKPILKPKLLHFFIGVFCALGSTAIAQELSLSGRVIDQANTPVSYSNLVLLKAQDSTVVTGTSSNEAGFFKFENLSADRYILKTSFIGFETNSLLVVLSKDTSLSPIVLNETAEALAEVTLVAKRPTLKKEQDRLVFNIENTTLTEGSIWDVLKGTPGVLMLNDEITVKNSGNIIYLINGKRVYLSGQELQQLLSGTNASAVQEVEVITNPPAKYDASGGAVINIKMSKNLIAGYNGSLYGNYTQGVYPRYNLGTSHFFKTDKLNVFLGYTYDYSKVNRINKEDVRFIENGNEVGQWLGNTDRNTQSKSHTANVNVDYNFNDLNTLSFSANGSLTPYWKRHTLSDTQAVDSSFVSRNITDDDSHTLAFNLGFQNTSKKGHTFSTNLHYTTYNYIRFQDVITDYYDASDAFMRSNMFISDSQQEVAIMAAQADYKLAFEDSSTLELGAKVSNIDSDSDFEQVLTNNNVQQVDVENTGLFTYTEANYAGYLSYAKDWESWSLSLGLRAEYTDATGELVASSVNDFDYFKLFPTFNLSHAFNANHNLGISYNKRIERPAYSNLNPFQFYLNDNTYVVGNPNLQPEITQLATLSYTLKGTYTFEVYYRHVDNPMSELIFQDNAANKIRYEASNLKQNVDYGFDFLMYKPFTKFWAVYVVNSIFKDNAQFFAVESGNAIQENSRWSMYSSATNYFTLSEKASLNAELSLLYISPVVYGSAEASSRAQVDFSMKKSFASGKWIASLAFNDIFQTTDFWVNNNYLNQRNKYYTRFDNQWVRFGLRYNFGNTRLKTNESSTKQSEQERIKTQD